MNNLSFRLLAIPLLAIVLATAARAEPLPRPDHVVVVIEENHSFSQIMDKRNSASYIHALAKSGVLFTQSYGVTHPSQPNYLALFSGATQHVGSNACPLYFKTDNLATVLLDGDLTFAGYAESLPAVGDRVCVSGPYQRKHNPVADWQGTRVSDELNKPFSDFPRDFSKLPTVSFVIPNQDNDMHDGSFEAADEWLKKNIAPYVDWAMKNNSLLILTWDEDDHTENNRVATIMVGPMVKPGESAQRINHYNVLHTLLEFYDLPAPGESRDAEGIKGIWLSPTK